jgi:hypothetical protein
MDLNQKEVFFTSKGNYGGCFSNNTGSKGSKRRHIKEDFLAKKIEKISCKLEI